MPQTIAPSRHFKLVPNPGFSYEMAACALAQHGRLDDLNKA
jgi:hypothetical protein